MITSGYVRVEWGGRPRGLRVRYPQAPYTLDVDEVDASKPEYAQGTSKNAASSSGSAAAGGGSAKTKSTPTKNVAKN
ncbi:unnamed protein product, partial [Amoebophrya sp. A25]|eukprot:GSA25T00011361001.1